MPRRLATLVRAESGGDAKRLQAVADIVEPDGHLPAVCPLFVTHPNRQGLERGVNDPHDELKYTKGLHDLGNGSWAYLLRMAVGVEQRRTDRRQRRDALGGHSFRPATDGRHARHDARCRSCGKEIDTLVNTHASGDHTYGNQLVDGAEIVASADCAAEMEIRPPEAFISRVNAWQDMGEAGLIIWELMGRKFDFTGIENRVPTRTLRPS